MKKAGKIPRAKSRELDPLTRRAFVPKLVVDIYRSTPLLNLLLAEPWYYRWWRKLRAWVFG